MIPLSLYLHIPWCLRKCPYCDFNSHKSPNDLPETAYVKALLQDLKNDVDRFSPREIQSIFIGGGTPSLFSPQAYEILFTKMRDLIPVSPTAEITLEANPGTVEQQRFKAYRQLGINRLSLGIQSFHPTHLKGLGRIHDHLQAHQSIETARRAGFENLNVDIMHGLPQQSIQEGLDDLKIALTYNPEHLSWYQLTLEPNTVFYKTQPVLPTEDEAYALEKEGFEFLKDQGYVRYEISAFSRPNQVAQHNMNYWLFGDYYGIGAGAHGKLTLSDGTVHRTRKHRQPKDYLDERKSFMAASGRVDAKDLVFEFMLNTTRLQQSIPFTLFTERTGLPLHSIQTQLQRAEAKGLIILNQDHWQITELGRQFTNDLQTLFLP